MNLVERIFHGGLSLSADVSGAPAPDSDFWYSPFGGHDSSSGMRVSPETSKRLATVIACVTVRANAISTLPLKIRMDLPGGGSTAVPDHPLYDVLYSRPNHWQTAKEFRFMMQAHVDLRGNAFAKKVPGPRGPVDQLIPMHPDYVMVEVLKGSGKLRYSYRNPLSGELEVLMQEEVFHLRDWSEDGYVGQSRISMGRDALGLALARQDYMARFLKNDARTGIMFEGGSFKTDDAKKSWIASVREAQTGPKRGSPMLLPPGMKATQLGITPVDAQLVEAHKMSQVEICTLMNTLPHLVGVETGKSSTYASMEQLNIMNAQQSIYPMAVTWEQCIQRDLIVNGRYYAKHNIAAVLRADTQTRYLGYNSAIQSGWMCPDDARELEDMNPIPGGAGKVFWRSANLVPLKQLVNPAKAAAPESSTEDSGPGNDSPSQAAMIGRLELLASGTAERCVRKEVAAVRRMIAASAGPYEVTEFYAEHVHWVAQAFNMDAATVLQLKAVCDERAQQLRALLADDDDEFHAGAQVWIDQVALTEPVKLAALAVKGGIQ